MRNLESVDRGWGITVARVVMGVILVKAGLDKLSNLAGTSGFLGQLGMPAPELLAPLLMLLELVGGILVLIGLGTRWVAPLFVIEFMTTTFVAKLPRAGWDASRIDMMMLAGALLLLLAGAGKASADEALLNRRARTAAPDLGLSNPSTE